MKIGIFGHHVQSSFISSIQELFQRIREENITLFIYEPFAQELESVHHIDIPKHTLYHSPEDFPSRIDFMISIGGDGTFLDTLSFINDSGIPVIGINSGRLGFLANIAQEEITKAFYSLLNQDYIIEPRTILRIEIDNGLFKGFPYALNEITIQKKDSAMITIHSYLDNEYLNSYWADGLIIATPTGSTAYSLSVGGPIVLPTTNDFIISPIAPHTLTVRPIVVPDHHELTLTIESRDSKYIASADHRFEIFDSNRTIYIKKANFLINMVKPKYSSFYTTLRNKLMWGKDTRN